MITISTRTTPLRLGAVRLAQSEIRDELERLSAMSLPQQISASKQHIILGTTDTFWANPLRAGLPPYIATAHGSTRRLHLLSPEREAFAIYEGQGKNWCRGIVTTSRTTILAALPQSAFSLPKEERLASPKQLELIRKIVGGDPSRPLPTLHVVAASRLIDRATTEKVLPELIEDFLAWHTACEENHAA